MVKIETKTGYKCKVNEKVLEDIRFLEDFSKMEKGEITAIFDLMDRILGDEQKEKLYKHCEDKDGLVPAETLGEELADVFEILSEKAETKN